VINSLLLKIIKMISISEAKKNTTNSRIIKYCCHTDNLIRVIIPFLRTLISRLVNPRLKNSPQKKYTI